MKYRELLPNEIEAYNIGYKNGSRQCVIKVLEFESVEEKKFYRQGYNAGCQDRKRHNVSINEIESNVSNVSNVDSYDSTIAITNTIVDTIANTDNDSNDNTITEKSVFGKNREDTKAKTHNMLEIVGNAYKATDAVVDVVDKPDGTIKEGIRIKNPRLMDFVRQRFDKNVLNKVSDWAIDHNQRGHTYNATALLKLLCKFQSNVEPTINFNHVQSEYLTFKYKGENK